MNPSNRLPIATQAESRVTAPVSCVLQKFTPPPLRRYNLPLNQPVSARRRFAALLLIFAFGLLVAPAVHAQATAPTAAPGNVMLIPADGEIIVSWDLVADADNGGSAITIYTATAIEGANTFTCAKNNIPTDCIPHRPEQRHCSTASPWSPPTA